MHSNELEMEKTAHGGINTEELISLGLEPKQVLDFSANINPLGVSSRVKKIMSDIEIARYPDPDCQELKRKLAENLDIAPNHIVVGNGSTELVHLLARAFLSGSDRALILAPTFGEYETACHLAGIDPVILWSREENGFRLDIEDICRQMADIKARLVFLCNPNNPTGTYLDEEAVRRIARAAFPGVLVIDEAYMPFVEQPWDSRPLLELGNVILLHSMTKDHALAGLRLGYALAPVKTAEKLKLYQPFWSVNEAAQAAGLAALSDPGHVTRARKIIADSRAYLYSALSGLGIEALPSSTNFLLVRAGDAGKVRRRLLMKNICVRDCASFGLPAYIRVSVRTLAECRKLVNGLSEVWNG